KTWCWPPAHCFSQPRSGSLCWALSPKFTRSCLRRSLGS
ncbi:uncharacterized protein METZ01_LOCUS55013, partial [marine metagenome]